MPKLCVPSLYSVDPLQLSERGIRGVMLDLDNTILPWNSVGLSGEALYWFEEMRINNISVCLVSNAHPKRIERALYPLNLPYVARATKPLLRGFRKGMRMLGIQPQECAMIGDQIFTDVLGANRLGVYSIFVQQDNLIEQRWMKGVRKVERWILRRNPRPLVVARELSSSIPPLVIPEASANWSTFKV